MRKWLDIFAGRCGKVARKPLTSLRVGVAGRCGKVAHKLLTSLREGCGWVLHIYYVYISPLSGAGGIFQEYYEKRFVVRAAS